MTAAPALFDDTRDLLVAFEEAGAEFLVVWLAPIARMVISIVGAARSSDEPSIQSPRCGAVNEGASPLRAAWPPRA